MAKTKILIAVKTYPTLASKYDKLVCTAGFREDGTWVRIYPIPFRKLDYDKQYKKFAPKAIAHTPLIMPLTLLGTLIPIIIGNFAKKLF